MAATFPPEMASKQTDVTTKVSFTTLKESEAQAIEILDIKKVNEAASLVKRFGSIIAYGMMGTLLVIANKAVLTSYKFKYIRVMGASQVLTITIVLRMAKAFGFVSFPDLSLKVAKDVFPLPIFYILNLFTGLMSTQRLSLPMWSVLRRLSIPVSLLLELFILKMVPKKKIVGSIAVIVLGSLVAAFKDFSFDLLGYICIILYNFSDALDAVLVKKKLNTNKTLGATGILYYCALFNVMPVFLIALLTDDLKEVRQFSGWSDPLFVLLFGFTSVCGLLFVYSWIMCNKFNSPVTVQVTSSMRNIIVTFAGMFVGGDYVFNLLNFVGLNVSILGGLLYTYFSFGPKKTEAKEKDPEDEGNKPFITDNDHENSGASSRID